MRALKEMVFHLCRAKAGIAGKRRGGAAKIGSEDGSAIHPFFTAVLQVLLEGSIADPFGDVAQMFAERIESPEEGVPRGGDDIVSVTVMGERATVRISVFWIEELIRFAADEIIAVGSTGGSCRIPATGG